MYVVLSIMIVGFIAANFLYRKTGHYYNTFCFDRLYFECGHFDMIQLVATGTSNSLAAVASQQANGNILVLSGRYQSLRLDHYLLQRTLDKLKPGTAVLIMLGPCVLMYDENLKRDINHHAVSNPLCPISLWVKLKRFFPLAFDPRLVKYLINDEERKTDFYTERTDEISEKEAASRMDHLLNSWKKEFQIDSFDPEKLGKKNHDTIQANIEFIKTMVSETKKHGMSPYLVTTPFSRYLLTRIGDKYIEYYRNCLHKISEETGALSLDFLKDQEFYSNISLFNDGGFVLNRQGSQLFMKRLLQKIEK